MEIHQKLKKMMASKETMQNINEDAKKAMQKALEQYKKDKSSVKEFYPCTQELTKWLKVQVK